MDENVDSAITRGLKVRGVNVLTVEDEHAKGTPDVLLLDRAMTLKRILFTMDRHFLIEATRRQRAGENFYGIVYIHPLDVDVGRCIDDLMTVAHLANPEDPSDKVLYLPL